MCFVVFLFMLFWKKEMTFRFGFRLMRTQKKKKKTRTRSYMLLLFPYFLSFYFAFFLFSFLFFSFLQKQRLRCFWLLGSHPNPISRIRCLSTNSPSSLALENVCVVCACFWARACVCVCLPLRTKILSIARWFTLPRTSGLLDGREMALVVAARAIRFSVQSVTSSRGAIFFYEFVLCKNTATLTLRKRVIWPAVIYYKLYFSLSHRAIDVLQFTGQIY